MPIEALAGLLRAGGTGWERVCQPLLREIE